MSDYPDHREEAEKVREQHEDLGEGVTRDALADANAELLTYNQQFSEIVAFADYIADNQGVLPDEVQEDVNEIRKTAQQLEEWTAAYASALKKEHEAYVEEMRDDE